MSDADLAPVRRIHIQLRRGMVTVTPAADDRLAWSASPDRVDGDVQGDRLDLTCRERVEVRVTVRIPGQGLEMLHVDIGSGQVLLEGIAARVEANVGNGRFRAERVTGSVNVDIGRGDVLVDGLEGALDVDAGLGSVQVVGVHGALSIDAGVGSVHVLDSDGNADIDSGTGSVTLVRMAGSAEIDSGMGSVTVESPRRLTLGVDSGMGSLRIQGGVLEKLTAELGRGSLAVHQSRILGAHCELETGSAQLLLDGRQPGRLEAVAYRGRVVSSLPRVSVPFAGAPRSGERAVLQFADGGPLLYVQTRRGSITVERGRTLDDDMEQQVDREREQRLILEELHAGRITPDAARRLLEALQNRRS